MSQTDESAGSLQRLLEALAQRTPGDVVCPVTPAQAIGSGSDGSYASAVDSYTLVIGEVAFAGNVPSAELPQALRSLTRSRRADLLGLAWSLLALRDGGRAVLVVPEALLSASTQAHCTLRRRLIEENGLEAVIRLAPGWYKSRTGAAILVARKGGCTESAWFYDLAARPRGREPKQRGRRGAPGMALSEPSDLLVRWETRAASAHDDARTGRYFAVARTGITPPAFDLGIDRHRLVQARPAPVLPRPHELLAEVAGLEAEIFEGIRQLVGMLK